MNIGLQLDRISTSCPARFLLCLLLVFLPLLATAQVVDEDFDPDADGGIDVIVVQPDGKLIVAGDFETIAGATRHRIARLNTDGSLDATFTDAYVDALIRAVALQADGRIVIGGNFHQVGTHSRSFLARLNSDGTVDDGFHADADAAVYALAVQDDGRIVVGGKFHSLGGVSRNFLARLNEAGGIDASYDPNPDSTVLALTVQGDGRLLAGGRFTSFATQCGTFTCTVFARRIARINVDGSVDDMFVPAVADGEVGAIAEQQDDAIVIAGTFTSIDSHVHQSIARLTAEGDVDSFFPAIDVDDGIDALALQEDGRILVAGDFTLIEGRDRNHVARLHADGSLDESFIADANDSVVTLAMEDDGALLIGGSFTLVTLVDGVERNRIARLLPVVPWRPPVDTLFSTGDFANADSPCSSYAGNSSRLAEASGAATFGFNSSLVEGYRVADDFTVPADSSWAVTEAYFFAYQNGSGPFSTIDQVNFRIWDAPPDADGTHVLCGDATTNELMATTNSGIFRESSSTLGWCNRPVMVQTVDVSSCPVLGPGTYWIDWQTGGNGALLGPWTPPLAAFPAGNGLQYSTGSGVWAALTDDGNGVRNGLPFVIAGSDAGGIIFRDGFDEPAP